MTEVGISVALYYGIGFLCRSFTRNVLYFPYGEPNLQLFVTVRAYQVPLT